MFHRNVSHRLFSFTTELDSSDNNGSFSTEGQKKQITKFASDTKKNMNSRKEIDENKENLDPLCDDILELPFHSAIRIWKASPSREKEVRLSAPTPCNSPRIKSNVRRKLLVRAN